MKPGFMAEVGGPRSSVIAGAELAFRLADAYPKHVPAPQELMERWGMARATAYRWVRTMKQARGLLMEEGKDG